MKLIDLATSTSLFLKKILIEKRILNEGGNLEENYYTTGSPEKVGRIAKVIFNNENFKIKKVRLTELELKTQSEIYARKKIKN